MRMLSRPVLSVGILVCLFAAADVGAQRHMYLGEGPPGPAPKVFAPGVVSTVDEYEYGSVFSADGFELYYGVNVGDRAEIRMMRWTGDQWSRPQVIVSDERFSFNDPFLSPDEERLYFISNRPLRPDSETPKDYDIWFSERRGDAWGSPVNLGPPVNTSSDEYYIAFSAGGRIYFASNRNAGERRRDFDVYAADLTAGGFEDPQVLRGELNTPRYEADAFLAPDESYIIYSSMRPEGLGQGDLYISVRRDDGSWSAGRSLGPEINTDGHELCPFVTADGRFFFYTSNEDVYWVDAGILEILRSEEPG